MELVVIEKNAYLQFFVDEDNGWTVYTLDDGLSAQIESVKKKIGPVEMEK